MKTSWCSHLNILLRLLALGVVGGAAGCSSTPDSTLPYATLKLTAIRQSPAGQLALVYDQQKPQPPGQRLYVVDQNVLGHEVSAALNEIKAHPGYGETFSGCVVIHRTYVYNTRGDEVFWAELDPFTLPGTWIPPLAQPPLPTDAAARALPESFRTPAAPAAVTNAPEMTPSALAQPNEHFIWLTANGTLETSIPRRTLFPPAYADTFSGNAEKVIGGTVAVIGGLAIVTGVVALDILLDTHYPYSYHYR